MTQEKIKLKLYKELPGIVKSILLNTSGFLVGGSIQELVEGIESKDYDILVPDREQYMSIIRILNPISDKIELNTFGGLKFSFVYEDTKNIDIDRIIVVDIWCEELSHFLSVTTKVDYIYNMKKAQLIQIF